MSIIIGDKYVVDNATDLKKYRSIALGKAMDTGEFVAIKFRSQSTKYKQMQVEAEVYEKIQGGIGIPAMKWFGIHGDDNVLVLEYIGPSLQELFKLCSNRFSLPTILKLADQILSRIIHIHMRNFIHCNIAPDNFLIDINRPKSPLYLIDYGLAKKYRDESTYEHIPFQKEKVKNIARARYASINTHKCVVQSRRDDLESLGYMLMYFNLGSLPWQGIKASNDRQKDELIVEKKVSTSLDDLCIGLPNEFFAYLNYCRRLRFDEIPNYLHLRAIFSNFLSKIKGINDNTFDWNLKHISYNPQKKQFLDVKQQKVITSLKGKSKQLNGDADNRADSDIKVPKLQLLTEVRYGVVKGDDLEMEFANGKSMIKTD